MKKVSPWDSIKDYRYKQLMIQIKVQTTHDPETNILWFYFTRVFTIWFL